MFSDPDWESVALLQRERKPSIREGPQYQAEVPVGPPMPRPTGAEEDDPRAALRGPTPEEALAIAAGPERQSAEDLPEDARLDAAPANLGGTLSPPSSVFATLNALSRVFEWHATFMVASRCETEASLI